MRNQSCTLHIQICRRSETNGSIRLWSISSHCFCMLYTAILFGQCPGLLINVGLWSSTCNFEFATILAIAYNDRQGFLWWRWNDHHEFEPPIKSRPILVFASAWPAQALIGLNAQPAKSGSTTTHVLLCQEMFQLEKKAIYAWYSDMQVQAYS